jgi:hypothetical protein
LSITLEVDFCIEAVEEALARHSKPDMCNTDQGSRVTSTAFTQVLMDTKISIPMDGRGAWRQECFLGKGCIEQSKMKRFFFTPAATCPRLGQPSETIGSSTIPNARIRGSITRHPIRLTSAGCRYSRPQLNKGQNLLINWTQTVQINRATSVVTIEKFNAIQ